MEHKNQRKDCRPIDTKFSTPGGCGGDFSLNSDILKLTEK